MGRLIQMAAGASPSAALQAPHEFDVEMPAPQDRFFTLGLEDFPITAEAATRVTAIEVVALANCIVGYVADGESSYVDTTDRLPHEIKAEGLQTLTQVGHILMVGVETHAPGKSVGHVRLRLHDASGPHPAFYTVWWGKAPV